MVVGLSEEMQVWDEAIALTAANVRACSDEDTECRSEAVAPLGQQAARRGW